MQSKDKANTIFIIHSLSNHANEASINSVTITVLQVSWKLTHHVDIS
jgi:hypothetical protein